MMSIPILWIFILINAKLVSGVPKLGHVLFDPLSYEANKFDKLKAFLRDVIDQNESVKPSTRFCSSCIEDTTEKIKPKPTTSEVPKIARNSEVPVKAPNKVSDLIKLFENAMEKIKLKNPLRQGSDDDKSKNKEPYAEYDFNGSKCRIVNNRLLCGYDKNKGELKTDEFIAIGNGCRQFKERVECGYEAPPFTGNIRRPPARDDKNLRSRNNDDLKNIARTVLKAISEQESKMKLSINGSETGLTESVSSKTNEDITKSTAATVIDLNSTITADVTNATLHKNSTLTTITELLVTSTTSLATESFTNVTTETTQNITSSLSSKLVTEPILEYLIKHFLPLRMLAESSSTTTLTPSTPSTLEVTSDLLVSETAVESSTSPESEEFLTNDIEINVAENSSVSTSPISEVTGYSSHLHINISHPSSRSAKIVRRSAEAESKETSNKPEVARNGDKPSRWCIEKGDRIVCYYADNSFVLD